MRQLGFILLFVGMTASLPAPPDPVPEISASSATSAITLLTGGMLVLRSRRNKQS